MTDPISDATFSALADQTRRAILGLIGEHGELSVGEIASRFDGVGRTAVSSHLRILRLAGLITERRDGRFRHYSLTSTPADTVVAFLASVYQNSLEQLEAAITEAVAAAGNTVQREDGLSA
ncbi:ArsR/SmtB family transcription factor [Candidatus Poriferisodalis sp.]|uniref:ArsR/SmtB family transcription factor n=1 Tax=Candidatus Poriferisodalis sp. TaxID=3101277 RepID=UPI003B5C3F1E